jgi:hypothetical protein
VDVDIHAALFRDAKDDVEVAFRIAIEARRVQPPTRSAPRPIASSSSSGVPRLMRMPF